MPKSVSSFLPLLRIVVDAKLLKFFKHSSMRGREREREYHLFNDV